MTIPAAKETRRGIWKVLLLIFLAGVLCVGALAWYLTSNSFQAMVRRQLIAQLERATGGRVEVGTFHTSPFRLRIEVLDITIHGRESANEVPYAHVDRLVAEVKVISLLGREFGFHSVLLQHPVVHVIFYPDGTTNQPQPRQPSNNSNSLERLFAFSISRLSVQQGALIWNDQVVPLDFQVQNVAANMNYLFFSRRYDGRIIVGKADAHIKGYKPFSWTADAQFSLSGQSLQIKSLSAASGRTRMQMTGAVTDFKRPSVTFGGQANIDMADAVAIMRDRDIRSGMMQLNAKGVWTQQGFSSGGTVAITDFEGKFDNVAADHAFFATSFNASSTRLVLSKIDARLWGGSVNGDADIKNWLAPVGAERRKSKAVVEEEPQGIARLQFKTISVGDAIDAMGIQASLLRKLNLAGNSDGSVQLRWKGAPQNAIAEIALAVVPPEKPQPGKVPLYTQLRGTYMGESQDLELAQFSAASQNTHINASGRLSSHAALKIAVDSNNIAELQPVISSFGYPKIPRFEHGNVSFYGSASGRLSDFLIAGNLKAEDFTVVLPVAHGYTPRKIHSDSFRTTLQFSPELLALRGASFKSGDTSVNFDLSADLLDGKMSEQNPFTFRIDLHDADIRDLMDITDYRLPVAGRANASLRLSGTLADPHGDGSMDLRDVEVAGQQLQQFDADLRFIHRQAEMNNVRFASYGGTSTGGILYDFHNKTFRFNLTGSNFDVSKLSLPVDHLSLTGRLGFHAQGAGSLAQPAIQADLQLHDLAINGNNAGDMTLKVAGAQGRLHLEGQTSLLQSRASLDGDIHLSGDWQTNANAQFTNWQMNQSLSRFAKVRFTGPSTVSGTLHIQGPLLHPRDMDIAGMLTDLSLDAENVKLHNSAPVNFSLSRRLFQVQQLHIVGDNTDLIASGSMLLQAPYTLDWNAQGTGNLRLIETFNHDFTARGRIGIKATGTGTLSQPSIDGQLTITRGSLAYINLPSALSEINGTVLFNQHEMKVQSLTARTGGGLITLSGGARIINKQLHFDLGVVGEDVRLRYPPGVSSTANVDLHLAGTPSSSLLSGDVTVTKLSVTPGFDFANYLARSQQTPVLVQTNTLLSRIGTDVHITTTPELQMQTASVRFSGDADLRVRGTLQTPAVLGRADILDGGQIYFNGSKYTLQRGDIVFLDPTSIVPILDLQANTQIRDYDITLRVTGDARRPTVNFQSEPPLPSADIIALLALGRTNSESGQPQQQSGLAPFNQDAGNVALAQAFNAAVSDRVQRLFGGSRIKIDPQGLSTETSLARGPALTIEQQVAGNLTLTYTTNISQTSQQIIQAQYNISKTVSIVGIRDQNGVVSFDVKIRQRKK